MAEPILNKSSSAGMVTARRDIDGFASEGNAMFSVNAGIPLGDAFDQLSILLSSAQSSVEALAIEESSESGVAWGSAHLLNFSYALVQAMHTGYLNGVKNG